MEQKDIDIFEILKNEEYGTELYTPKCGSVWHSGMANDKDSAKAIWTEDGAGREHFFDKNGKIYKEGEILLFPSKQMRDWSKFFKKGDVLVNKDGDVYIIFERFSDDTYCSFVGKYYLWKENNDTEHFYKNERLLTSDFQKAGKDAAQTYISTIEERLGGKLNRETLEIEKTQPEFKDGDIVFEEGNRNYCSAIGVLKKDEQGCFMFDTFLTKDKVCYNSEYIYLPIRLATEEEKKQFFSALEKEGKAFDAEKKQIVGLKPAFEIGKLYVFREEDEDGELTIIGKLIDKNESEDTLTFGNQYEIENEKFVTDQAFDLRISVNTELREATENEVELFNKHYAIWKKEKEAREHPVFKTFDKVLVRDGKEYEWLPALFVRDRGEGANYRYKVLSLRSGKPAEFACCIPYEGNENIIFTDHNIDNLPF